MLRAATRRMVTASRPSASASATAAAAIAARLCRAFGPRPPRSGMSQIDSGGTGPGPGGCGASITRHHLPELAARSAPRARALPAASLTSGGTESMLAKPTYIVRRGTTMTTTVPVPSVRSVPERRSAPDGPADGPAVPARPARAPVRGQGRRGDRGARRGRRHPAHRPLRPPAGRPAACPAGPVPVRPGIPVELPVRRPVRGAGLPRDPAELPRHRRLDRPGFEPFRHEQADGLATVAWLRQQDWFTGSLATMGRVTSATSSWPWPRTRPPNSAP